MTAQRTYLDYNATAPLRSEARAAMVAALDCMGNPSSIHAEGRAVRAIVETAREQVAALVGAKPGEVIFTSGATESNVLALMGRPWRAVCFGDAEHASVLSPARRLDTAREEFTCGADGVQLIARAVDWATGSYSHDRAPVLFSLGLANGESGVLQPVRELVEAVHESGAVVHCDAAQAAGRIPVDFSALGVGLLSVSAHKMGGPKGAGALVVRDGLALDPLLTGGGQERRRRAGTENVAAIAGFGAAADAARLDLQSMESVRALRDRLETGVKRTTPDCVVLGSDVARLPNTSLLALPGRMAETLVIKFDLAGFAVSAGAACSSGKVGTSHVLEAMRLPPEIARSAIRISLGSGSSEDDVERFLAAWKAVTARSALAA